jgi:hypothetical protein
VTKAVAASSAMLPLVTTQTVGFARGFGGRIFARENPGLASSSHSTSIAKLGPASILMATVSTWSSRAQPQRIGATATGRTASSAGSAWARSRMFR